LIIILSLRRDQTALVISDPFDTVMTSERTTDDFVYWSCKHKHIAPLVYDFYRFVSQLSYP